INRYYSTVEIQNAELKNLNSTKDKLFSVIAHDLRSPFSSMLGISDVLREKSDTMDREKLNKWIIMLNESTQKTSDLLQNLLGWANSQLQRINFKPVSVNLEKITEYVLDVLDSGIKSKNIHIVRNLHKGGEITADENMLKIIMQNLLSNAIKFTYPDGQVEISSKLSPGWVEISIKDNGVGMESKDIDKLFNVNTTYSKPGTANEKGTGLGLILCREFVEKHSGEIRVTSELKKGSIFTFTLKQ
ncbi:MAG: HAMP domain-containing sensor histidine kinase, partial [Draconibacterium sp.]|nr:HAMP domain-containing sensor histidine kinase [Draconibacterium sp.]